MVAAQSALERGGVGASDIHTLTTVMVAGAFGGRSIQPSRNLWLFDGGVALPVAVPTPLILYSSATAQERFWRWRTISE